MIKQTYYTFLTELDTLIMKCPLQYTHDTIKQTYCNFLTELDFTLKWPNTQHRGHLGQNIQNLKNNRNTTSQVNEVCAKY